MNIGGLSKIIKGIGGEPEVGRTLLTFGGFVSIVSPVVFEAVDMYRNGAHFDVAAWCLAYPAGLGALIASGVISLGNKDKSVAAAIQTRDQTTASVAPASS